MRLLLAGRPSVDDQRLIAEADLGDAVGTSGWSTRDESLSIQRGADALLLLTGHNRSEATGKLFEYLASGRPILALAEGNEAARIVRETGTGVAVGGGDPAGLRDGARSARRRLAGARLRPARPRALPLSGSRRGRRRADRDRASGAIADRRVCHHAARRTATPSLLGPLNQPSAMPPAPPSPSHLSLRSVPVRRVSLLDVPLALVDYERTLDWIDDAVDRRRAAATSASPPCTR